MRTTIAELCGFPNKLVADARVSGHTSAIVIKAGRNPIPQEPSHELLKIR
jgi:hypothetical protein